MHNKKELGVIDATTGTILSPGNLYAVLATAEALDQACDSDAEAHDLAVRKGRRISEVLLAGIAKGAADHEVIDVLCRIFKFSKEVDNDNQIVLYTDVRYNAPESA